MQKDLRTASAPVSLFPIAIGFLSHLTFFLFATAAAFHSEAGHDLGGFLLERFGLPSEMILLLVIIALLTRAIRGNAFTRLLYSAGLYTAAILCWLPLLTFVEQQDPQAAPQFLIFWAFGMFLLPASIFLGGHNAGQFRRYLIYMVLLTAFFFCIPFEFETFEIVGLACAAVISITMIWELTKLVEEYEQGEAYCASLHLLASATTVLPAFYNVKALASYPLAPGSAGPESKE
jgi:hypothetical protein